MVLTNQLFLGLVLFTSLTCISTTTTTSDPSITATTIPLKATVQSENTTNTQQSQPPKTEPNQTYILGTTSTETPDEKRKIREDKTRQDGARALDIESEKFAIPDFHSENNVFSESKGYEKELPSKSMEYERMFDNLELTTPESMFFDSRHKQVQEDIARAMKEREKTITMQLEQDDKYFYSKAPEFLPPSENDEHKVDEMKKIESNESKIKNKIHKDYTVETSRKVEMVRVYNETKTIVEPKNGENKTDVSQNEVKVDAKIEKKPMDLDQDSSDHISEIHAENVKQQVNVDNQKNSSLNKEQLDPIIVSDKEIVVTKRGPKTKHKATTPIINLEDLNAVEVTTKAKNVQTITDTNLRKIESSDMKMINVINLDEPTTPKESELRKQGYEVQEESMTTESETTLNDQGNNTMGVDTTESVITITNTAEFTLSTIEETSETITTETDNIETTTAEVFDESGTNFGSLIEEILTNSTEVAPDTTVVTTEKFYNADDDDDESIFYEVTTEKSHKTSEGKKNETISSIANEIFKVPSSSLPTSTPQPSQPYSSPLPSSSHESSTSKFSSIPSSPAVTFSTESNEVKTIQPVENTTQAKIFNTTKINENEIIKQNEINVLGDKLLKVSTTEEPIEKDCYTEQCEDADDEYIDPNGNKKSQDLEDMEETSEKGMVNYDAKITVKPSPTANEVDTNNIKPNLRFFNLSTPRFKPQEVDIEVTTTPAGLVDDDGDDEEDGNGGKIAAIVISTVGAICLFLLVGLLIVMRKRQKRFNYGQRCRPVSLDAYSMDNVSIHNSTRRKGVLMTSKRSYGNAAFEDPNSPSHPLTFPELVKFANNLEEIQNEFEQIPQVQAKTSELPEGCEVKNRYANVIPLPETRVFLSNVDGDPTSDYINANYVTGAKSERRYYIACQAPLLGTIDDFWRMMWEQESKVILMLTHLYEHGVEKCVDYLPPSEVLDCHRLFGDFQVTLKKREVRDKYIISSLQLKNMVSNSWRKVTHIWYIEWPHKGVPDEANSLIRFLIEARSFMKMNEIKAREANTSFIQGTTPRTPPVVVHCSPGTGRTGTVIACDIAIREFEQSRQVDIPKIVYKIRRDRASSVQTKEQYSFIYKVINLYATKLTGGAFDSF